MKERGKMIKALLYVGATIGFLFGAAVLPVAAAGESTSQGTIIDHRDMHLDLEALSAAEGLPYEYMIPEKEVVKTRIDPRDVYLNPEVLSGAEGLPYRYQIDYDKYIPVKYSPQDMDMDIEKMLSDDPSFVRGQENY